MPTLLDILVRRVISDHLNDVPSGTPVEPLRLHPDDYAELLRDLDALDGSIDNDNPGNDTLVGVPFVSDPGAIRVPR